VTNPPDPRRRVPLPKHPGIYRRGDRYQVRWRHNGHERTRSFRTLSEATRFKRRVDAGDRAPTSREPFESYAKEWLATYSGRTARGVSPSTRESYRDALDRFAVPYFRRTPLDRIDPPALRGYIAWLADRGLAPASVRRAYAPVRALLATAFEDGRLVRNPAAGVRVVVKDRRARTPKWLTSEQTRTLLAAMPAEHADLAYFLAATGARISEALAVRWRDVAPDEAGRPCVTITESKTEAGLRTILLSPDLARRLMERRAAVRYGGPDDPIFASATGTPIDPRNWRRRVFNPAAEAAGVPWATPHKLRHGLASLMADRGYSAAQIAAQLGHADGGVLALRTYIHADRLDSTAFVDEALTEGAS